MNRYPGDWIWAACLYPWYLAASTWAGVLEAVTQTEDRRAAA